MVFWKQFKNWHEAETEWDRISKEAEQKSPLKVLKSLPNMPGITPDTAKYLRWKSLKWMIKKDKNRQLLKNIIFRPLFHLKRYLGSLFSKEAFRREEDLFFYGIKDAADFEKLLIKPNTLLILGFSYCHKPFECPSGRFSDLCIHDLENLACKQCFIGKCVHANVDTNCIPVYIPTVHYIGNKVFELIKLYSDKEIIFLITACEMTLTMFADWGNMAGIKGVGIRLDGRICNTMKAFELSEEGIKPGLTVVKENAKQQMLHWLQLRSSHKSSS